ncbi:hypothetical protein T481_17880, partial [Enterococcus faecalis PF3]
APKKKKTKKKKQEVRPLSELVKRGGA